MPGLEAAKMYASLAVSLVGALATALVGIYGADSDTGKVVTVALAIVTTLGTALATYQTPNKQPASNPLTNPH